MVLFCLVIITTQTAPTLNWRHGRHEGIQVTTLLAHDLRGCDVNKPPLCLQVFSDLWHVARGNVRLREREAHVLIAVRP